MIATSYTAPAPPLTCNISRPIRLAHAAVERVRRIGQAGHDGNLVQLMAAAGVLKVMIVVGAIDVAATTAGATGYKACGRRGAGSGLLRIFAAA